MTTRPSDGQAIRFELEPRLPDPEPGASADWATAPWWAMRELNPRSSGCGPDVFPLDQSPKERFVVGHRGVEPRASCSRSRRRSNATRAR